MESLATGAIRPGTPGSTSRVLAIPAAAPETAHDHFRARLSFETDASDVYTDQQNGAAGFLLVDTRAHADYEAEHLPGAFSLPHSEMSAETTRGLPRDVLLVTYCWGPGCNAATKGALRLASLGFPVKEMIGGLEYWKREGYPTVSS
jgi:rhodanese-related sulfurtransferase